MATVKESSPVAENVANLTNFLSTLSTDNEQKPRNGVDFSSINGKVRFIIIQIFTNLQCNRSTIETTLI